MSFKAGDRVVYPHHGAAVVEKKEKIAAFGHEEREYLVLRMAHGEMTLRVPVDSVDDVGMRWPISGDDVDDLFDVLRKRDVREPSNWSRRFKNHQEKLKSGDVYQVAEVVRNLALRDRDKGCRLARRPCTKKHVLFWSANSASPSTSAKTTPWTRSTAHSSNRVRIG